jgi:hypothetical protein
VGERGEEEAPTLKGGERGEDTPSLKGEKRGEEVLLSRIDES